MPRSLARGEGAPAPGGVWRPRTGVLSPAAAVADDGGGGRTGLCLCVAAEISAGRCTLSLCRSSAARVLARTDPARRGRGPARGRDRGASGVGLSWRIGQLPAASSGWSGCMGTGVTSAATTCTTPPARRWSTLWLGSGWFTTPESTAKNSSWDTTTTLSGKEVDWGRGERLGVETGRVRRRMTKRAFLESDLEPSGVKDSLWNSMELQKSC